MLVKLWKKNYPALTSNPHLRAIDEEVNPSLKSAFLGAATNLCSSVCRVLVSALSFTRENLTAFFGQFLHEKSPEHRELAVETGGNGISPR